MLRVERLFYVTRFQKASLEGTEGHWNLEEIHPEKKGEWCA